jgi:tetratricopeptide (TPR) repeat protein
MNRILKNVSFLTLIFVLIISNAFSNPGQQNSDKVDVLQILMELHRYAERETDANNKYENLFLQVENALLHEMYVPPQRFLPVFLSRLERILLSDSLLLKKIESLDNRRILLNYLEFKFRALVRAQFHLEAIFLQLSSSDKIRYMVRYLLTKKQISQLKTDLLFRMFKLHAQLQGRVLKRDYWQAIERMMAEIDLQASETQRQEIQYSGYGLIVHPGIVLQNLRWQMQEEEHVDSAQLAARVIAGIENAGSRYKKLGRYDIEIAFPESGSLPEIDWDEAVSYYEKALLSEENDRKISYYSKALQVYPMLHSAYYNRGIAYYEKAKYREAIDDFNRSLDLEPNSALTFLYRGVCFQKLEEWDSAIDSYSRSIQLDPNPVTALMNRGSCYQKQKQFKMALADYDSVLEHNPENITAMMNRGFCFQQMKNYKKAIETYQQVIEIDKENASAYYNLGSIYWVQRNWKEVIDAWEKCLDIDPYHQQVLDHLPTAKVNAAMKYRKRTYIIQSTDEE